ncbi:MAG: hypothetical protein COA90_05375 [Gammaproteobacteria bacterium]|nr:MAG: hypothetical protein COA90_05375 [Gammaproteobacteria bacterium]
MDGSISIHGVSVSLDAETYFDIGSIELKLDSPFSYIDFKKQINTGGIPAKLQLKINHAYADLDLLTFLTKKPSKFDVIKAYATALKCGEIESFDYENLSDLGYSGIDSSINLDFEYNKLSKLVEMKFDLVLHDIESYSFSTSVPNIEYAQDFANPDNEIKHLEFKIENLGYNNKVTKFCSEKSGLDTDTYMAQYSAALKNYLTKANVKLSDSIYQAYDEYLYKQAPITFSFQPTDAINLKYIHLYETKDWPNILGLTLYVGDNVVDELSIDWNRDVVISNLLKSRNNLKIMTTDTNVKVKKITRTSSSRSTSNTDNFISIPVAKIDQYIGSKVKLKLKNKLGKSYDGVVKEFSGNQVIIKIRMHGGRVELPIYIEDIGSVLVYK